MRVDEVRAENVHIALDADDMHIALDAEIFIIPEACFEHLEAQGNKRARKMRKRAETDWDSRANLNGRWTKIQRKQRTVRMRKERIEHTKVLLMDQVDAENMQFPMIALDDTSMDDKMLVRKTADIPEADAVVECNMPDEITMAEQDNEIKGVMEMLMRKTQEKARLKDIWKYASR
jgi:hypothetical protein